MEKLTIKHLAPYLPYELKLKEGELSSISNRWNTLKYVDSEMDDYNTSFDMVTPILRPLSDLTKEITVNGETFIVTTKIRELFDKKDADKFIADFYFYNNIGRIKVIQTAPYNIVQKLLSWHFDCFGLLEKNLAIDINTLNNK